MASKIDWRKSSRNGSEPAAVETDPFNAPYDDPRGREIYGSRVREGIVTWPIDYEKYTEWRLLHRGYVPRKQQTGWLTGFYHFNRHGVRAGGWDSDYLDEDGYNEIAFVPIGEQANSWAEQTWKRSFPALYKWYADEKEMRPYWHNAILFIKNDVYIHTDKTWTETGGAWYGNDNDDDDDKDWYGNEDDDDDMNEGEDD